MYRSNRGYVQFNKNITNKITIIEAFYGKQYTGIKPSGVTGFKEISASNQNDILKNLMSYNAMDFSGTIFVEWKLINLNLIYWQNTLKYNSKVIKSICNCLKNNNKLFVDDISL